MPGRMTKQRRRNREMCVKLILSHFPLILHLPKSSDLTTTSCTSLSFTSCNRFLAVIQSLCDVSGDFSIPCSYLTPVPEALRNDADTTDLPEILWNFSHF